MSGKSISEILATGWGAHRRRFIVARCNGAMVVADTGAVLGQCWVIEMPKPPGTGGPATVRTGILPRDAIQAVLRGQFEHEALAVLMVSEALSCLGVRGSERSMAAASVSLFSDSIRDPRIGARLPIAALVAAEQKRFEEAGLADFSASLEPRAVQALAAVSEYGKREYAFYAEPGHVGEIRRQAASVYPMLAGIMATRFSLRAAIDEQSSLVEALQESFGRNADGAFRVGKGVLKRLQNQTWSNNGVQPEHLLYAMGRIPADWIPTTTDEWDAFCDIEASVGVVLRDVTGIEAEALYAGCGGKWVDFRHRMAVAITDTRPPEGTGEDDLPVLKAAFDAKLLAKAPRDKVPGLVASMLDQATLPEHLSKEAVSEWLQRLYAPPMDRALLVAACRDVADMMRAFSQKVLLPLAANKSGLAIVHLANLHRDLSEAGATDVLFAGSAAPAILANSRHFHSQAPAILGAAADEPAPSEAAKIAIADEMLRTLKAIPQSGVLDWAPLCNVVQAPNGVCIVPLCATSLLREEGAALHHCVGGYSDSCIRHGHHILSLRILTHNGFQRLSTAEVMPIVQGRAITYNQHRGESNREAPRDARDALDWFTNEFNAGRIAQNPDGRSLSALGVGAKAFDEIATDCGYRWQEREKVEEAMRPWGRYVGKKYRAMDLNRFGEEDAVTAIVKAIEPSWRPESEAAMPALALG